MASAVNRIDLVFAMDCTGSMGSYINQAQQSIRNIVNDINGVDRCDVRLALVEYRDHPPQDKTFVTRVLNFTSDVNTMKRRLDACSAEGGGDEPEAVADALYQVLNLSWSSDSIKICVLVSDAPPHGLSSSDSFSRCPAGHDPIQISHQMKKKGVIIYTLGCEPSITPYKDWFDTICYNTTGAYYSLRDATSLSKVIVGSVKKEISLAPLLAEVKKNIQIHKGKGVRSEQDIVEEVHSELKKKGVTVDHLERGGVRVGESSDKAKEMSKLTSMDEVKRNFSLLAVSSLDTGPTGGKGKSEAEASYEVVRGDIDRDDTEKIVKRVLLAEYQPVEELK